MCLLRHVVVGAAAALLVISSLGGGRAWGAERDKKRGAVRVVQVKVQIPDEGDPTAKITTTWYAPAGTRTESGSQVTIRPAGATFEYALDGNKREVKRRDDLALTPENKAAAVGALRQYRPTDLVDTAMTADILRLITDQPKPSKSRRMETFLRRRCRVESQTLTSGTFAIETTFWHATIRGHEVPLRGIVSVSFAGAKSVVLTDTVSIEELDSAPAGLLDIPEGHTRV